MNKISDVALSLVISGVTTVLYACAYNITAPAIGNKPIPDKWVLFLWFYCFLGDLAISFWRNKGKSG